MRFLFFSVLVIFSSCKDKHTNKFSFYYWKSASDELGYKEDSVMQDVHFQKLYVKFFDVTWKEEFGAVPVSKTNLFKDGHRFWKKEDIIPVVFITTETLKNIQNADIDSLAGNILFLVHKYYARMQQENVYSGSGKTSLDNIKEIQIDCDWTESVKVKYFQLLKAVKKQSPFTLLSCTIRLYPFKYNTKMGIPPVDKGVLMCYNLQSPLSQDSANSILDPAQMKLYFSRTSRKYPLHLDIALPLFSILVTYHNNEFIKLVNSSQVNISQDLEPYGKPYYRLKRNMEIGDYYFREGDIFRYEEISAAAILNARKILEQYGMIQDSTYYIYYHLDSDELSKYNHEELYHILHPAG